jgi:serine/threonine-protein kinase
MYLIIEEGSMLTPGTWLQSRYRIVRDIGGGGMGTVYLAEDSHLPGSRWAIKEMSPSQVPAQDRNWAIGAFQQEAQLLANLNHPGIVRVSDHFAEYGNWYLVMEYIEGQTLETYLHPQGLPPHIVLSYMDQLCEVLDYLHRQTPPVIFRDLKPGNIMIRPTGEIKLIDFGIARFFKPGQSHNTVNLGTPGYASPEHASGQTDNRSDIYSLGVLLLQLETGYDPTIAQVPFLLPAARSLNPQTPPGVEAIIQRATQLTPVQRFQTVTEFRQALHTPTPQNFAPPSQPPGYPRTTVMPPPYGPGQTATPARPPSRVPRWIWAAAAIVLLLLTGVVVLPRLAPQAAPTAVPPSAPMTLPKSNPDEAKPAEGLRPKTDTPTLEPVVPPPSDTPAAVVPALEKNFIVQDRELGRTAGGRSLSMLEVGQADGPVAVLVGSIEGDQADTADAVRRLMDWYRSRPDQVPNGGLLYLIPSLCPDGNAGNSRFNANEVDLNRNWDSGNWVSNAVVPGYPNGKPGAGGAFPFSEPETSALRDLLNRFYSEGRTVYLITLHSTVNSGLSKQVFPGYTSTSIHDASRDLTQRVGNVLGYRYNTAWSYDTTGEAIAWAAEQGIPSVDIVSLKNNEPDRTAMIKVLEEILR